MSEIILKQNNKLVELSVTDLREIASNAYKALCYELTLGNWLEIADDEEEQRDFFEGGFRSSFYVEPNFYWKQYERYTKLAGDGKGCGPKEDIIRIAQKWYNYHKEKNKTHA